MRSPEFGALAEDPRPFVILVPCGSVEPHGPHLPLETDTIISDAAAERAAALLEKRGCLTAIAPAVPYGVTDCAEGFPGAVSLPAQALTAYLVAVVHGFLRAGADHVCLVNNHLEPAHDAAIRAAEAQIRTTRDPERPEPVSVACPLEREVARTLTDEFKRGECHAGRYETSIVMAAAPHTVDDDARMALAEVPISLSRALRAGVTTFRAMGLDAAYAGAPAEATPTEGHASLDRLADMVVRAISHRLNI